MTTIILVSLLLFSLLGINILFFAGNVIETVFEFLQNVLNTFVSFFKTVLSDLGFISGKAINESSEIVSGVAKGGIDVANGVVHDVGNIIIKTSVKDGSTVAPVNIHTIHSDQLLSELTNIRLGELHDYDFPELPKMPLSEIPDPSLPAMNNIKIPDLHDIDKQLRPFDFVIDSSVRITPPADCKQCINVATTAPPVTTLPANDKAGGWCFVGLDDNKRICTEMKSGDKCASNGVFGDKDKCVKG